MDLTGAEMIVAERVRQLKKGYTPQHDCDNECGTPEGSPLMNDALNLVSNVFNDEEDSSAMMMCDYPFGESAVDKLVMAGALIAAQIDAIKEDEARQENFHKRPADLISEVEAEAMEDEMHGSPGGDGV